jgi:hypothetical protein
MKTVPATIHRMSDPERVLRNLIDVDPRVQLTEAETRSAALQKVLRLIDREAAKPSARVTEMVFLDVDSQRRLIVELSGGYALMLPPTTSGKTL